MAAPAAPAAATGDAAACALTVVRPPHHGTPGTSCWGFDLSAVPAHSWPLNTSTCPSLCNAFVVASPCALAAKTGCKTGKGSGKLAPAYQISNADGSCYALGSLGSATASLLGVPGTAAPTGVRLEYHGGDAGRSFAYELTCNDNDQGGPDAGAGIVETHSGEQDMYTVQWAHKAFCPKKLTGAQCARSPPPNPPGPPPPAPGPPSPTPAPPWGSVPVPTAPQLAYYRSELRALIHFNMATFIKDGDPGCSAEVRASTDPAADPAAAADRDRRFFSGLEPEEALRRRPEQRPGDFQPDAAELQPVD